MQSVLNSVKGTALGVAEYLTPVLKASILLMMFNMLYHNVPFTPPIKINKTYEFISGIEIS